MNNRNWFYIGAGLGIAAGYLLNSDKGREVQNQTSKYLNSSVEELKDKSHDAIQQATTVMSSLKEKGNSYLNNINQPSVTSNEVEQFIDSKVSELKQTLLNDVGHLNGKVSI